MIGTTQPQKNFSKSDDAGHLLVILLNGSENPSPIGGGCFSPEQIRAAQLRCPERLSLPPPGDLPMIPGKENGRNFPTMELFGASIVGMIELTGLKGFRDCRLIIPQDAGNEADNGVGQHEGAEHGAGAAAAPAAAASDPPPTAPIKQTMANLDALLGIEPEADPAEQVRR